MGVGITSTHDREPYRHSPVQRRSGGGIHKDGKTMPYITSGKCVYKKNPDGSRGKKVGCTEGSVKDYLAALHMHANEGMDSTDPMQKIPHLPGDLKHKFHWAIEYPYETEYGIDDSKHFIGSLRKDWPEDSDMNPPRLVTGYLPNDMSVERKRQHSYTTSLEKGWYVIEQAPLSGQQPILGPFSSHKEAYAAGKELYEREELRENRKMKITPSRLKQIIQEEVEKFVQNEVEDERHKKKMLGVADELEDASDDIEDEYMKEVGEGGKKQVKKVKHKGKTYKVSGPTWKAITSDKESGVGKVTPGEFEKASKQAEKWGAKDPDAVAAAARIVARKKSGKSMKLSPKEKAARKRKLPGGESGK